ncbi:Hypothetical predicted protein [Pelobates cultripes]|uniref:Uncharacterized protein n=1 Tax=Pelobates cultripes TaxID=61616 RepID=A0AAD1T534_PELCU|nr:Hypothetical predicted protein [Pelobates cultripes]
MAPVEGRTADSLEDSQEEAETSLISPRRGDLHREAESDEDSSPATKGDIKHMLPPNLEVGPPRDTTGNGGNTEQAPSGGGERQRPESPAASH